MERRGPRRKGPFRVGGGQAGIVGIAGIVRIVGIVETVGYIGILGKTSDHARISQKGRCGTRSRHKVAHPPPAQGVTRFLAAQKKTPPYIYIYI